MSEYNLVATAAMGLESIVASEIKDLGYDCQTENGKVYFTGDEEAIARTNMWLRVGDRVRIIVGEFKAFTFDELFERTKALPWEEFLPVDAAFPVSGKSVKSKLFSVPDCQAIVKKAIVERLNSAYKRTGFLSESGPLFKLEVSILKDQVTLTIDSSGQGLHKRGYRMAQGDAPLKETMAAALVKLSKWSPNRPFVDPFCGSGTIAIEAAMIGQNLAPGYNRSFLSEEWPWMKADVWDRVREEVEDVAKYDLALDIRGFDVDHNIVSVAQRNAMEAGFTDLISFEQRDVRDLILEGQNGVLIANPPYGERLGEVEEAEDIAGVLGEIMKQYPSWSVYILSSLENYETMYGKRATKKRKLFNGFIRTDLYQFWGQRS
ncbi:class I SAM-dependent RNA methyltransferase [Sporosarcina sp. P21c]|uniref:THUMP domain-containing class I SAM-dependent RNA methyltransferase n=1 Tax=Sporosarcina TaxID=1569 RepID=UPI000A14FFA2|nr:MULTISPECIES: class I SAM-dependent RNA methyltransferase [Sporosarcina]ARJ40234.1 RNA methyltransferase [Sporosarcina ureae]PIC68565.1 class I SAM-dependent RNA methyltransferase [Sporosarcina sp. P16a]PIC91249.1 class I SAM-dependent RNA methyltransferase [Sporosarcina sp. P21c]PIC93618.1 class I SAM-dependent RNA methyltransferase [Sporosarcina sp. P25]